MSPESFAGHDFKSIRSIRTAIDSGQAVRQIVQTHLDTIESQDKHLHAIVQINPNVLAQADRLDSLKAADRGPLHGVPIIVKDQIETSDMATSFGSKVCKDYTPSRDATLVSKLKAAGAVILAKSTMPDWAASWFSTSSLSGTTCNPHDPKRDAGGSSSGSGAAVSAGMCVVAIGGDTGGSIRLPSSFCGLVGVRVTPGRVSRDGMSALVVPQDTPGPMASSVEDAARVLDVVAGYDERDEFTAVNALALHFPLPFTRSIEFPSMQEVRLGVLREAFGSHGGINEVMERTLEECRSEGAELVDVSIPDLEYYKTFTSVYGTRSKNDIDEFLASRPALSGLKIEDIQARGDYHEALDLIDVIAKGPSDFVQSPHFAKRLLERAKFQRIVAGIFAREKLDAIIYPTCQVLAPKTKDVLGGRWTCLNFPTNTIIASQLLFPAASIPVGKTRDTEEDPSGPALPVGLEILGLPMRDENMLAIAAGIEQTVEWYQKKRGG